MPISSVINAMKLATYNVNGVNGRLPVLLRWLEQSVPDVVCLQELKTPDDKVPIAAIPVFAAATMPRASIRHTNSRWASQQVVESTSDRLEHALIKSA
jgi:exonuclease III